MVVQNVCHGFCEVNYADNLPAGDHATSRTTAPTASRFHCVMGDKRLDRLIALLRALYCDTSMKAVYSTLLVHRRLIDSLAYSLGKSDPAESSKRITETLVRAVRAVMVMVMVIVNAIRGGDFIMDVWCLKR